MFVLVVVRCSYSLLIMTCSVCVSGGEMFILIILIMTCSVCVSGGEMFILITHHDMQCLC